MVAVISVELSPPRLICDYPPANFQLPATVIFWKSNGTFILVLPAIRYLSCMAIKFADDNLKLSELQLESIEHFVADYNAIDHFFRKALCLDE